jgi:replicative DNA helicase
MIEMQLPASIMAEEAVLACVMADPHSLTLIIDRLMPEHFYAEHTRACYEVMLYLLRERIGIDSLTISEELESRGQYTMVIQRMKLMDQFGSSYQVEAHAQKVTEYWRYREMIRVAQALADGAYHKDADALATAESALHKVSEGRSVSERVVAHRDAIGVYLADLLERQERGELQGISTGIFTLDQKIGGLCPGEVTILGGRPGDGKTALALCMADSAVRAGCRVLFFSLEMRKEELFQRWIAMTAHIDSTHLRNMTLSSVPDREGFTEMDRVVAAEQELRELPGLLLVDDTSGNTDGMMKSRAIRTQAEHGLDLIIVDYVQLAHAVEPSARKDRVGEIAEIIRNLKRLARDLNVPVLALAQLNRGAATSAGPRMENFRESGEIENTADTAMVLQRVVEEDGDVNASEYDVTLHVVKNRHGERGPVNLHFVGKYTRFYGVRYAGEVGK